MNPVNSQFFSETPSKIHSLPLESLQHALGYLGSQDLVSFSSTNRYLRGVVWLDARLMAPILINAPSLMPFASAASHTFLSDPSYVKKIINARHFTKVCQLIGSNVKLDHLLARACIFYSKTAPKDALTHAYRIKSPYQRSYALGHIAASCNKPEILEEALSCSRLMNDAEEVECIIAEFTRRNASRDVHQLLKFARLISSPEVKVNAFIEIAKKCDETSKNVALDEALAAAQQVGELQVFYMCEIVRILDRERAMACLNRMISMTKEMPHCGIKDCNFGAISYTLTSFDAPKALTLIDAIVVDHIKIEALCGFASKVLRFDHEQGMIIIRKLHAIADQMEMGDPLWKSDALFQIVKIDGLPPSYTKKLWQEVIELEKLVVYEGVRSDMRFYSACEALAPIDLDMALKTAKLITSTEYYIRAIMEIRRIHSSKIEENIFNEVYQKLMASDVPSDLDLYYFSKYVSSHAIDLAVKAARRIIDPFWKGLALFRLAKDILPVLPLKSIELAEEGLLSLNQISELNKRIDTFEQFV